MLTFPVEIAWFVQELIEPIVIHNDFYTISYQSVVVLHAAKSAVEF